MFIAFKNSLLQIYIFLLKFGIKIYLKLKQDNLFIKNFLRLL